MAHELTKRGLHVVRQLAIAVTWESIHLEAGFRADLIVEGKVIVEVKPVEAIAPVHAKRLSTYLRQAAAIVDQLQCGADPRWGPAAR
jgi:GxxExxY protein